MVISLLPAHTTNPTHHAVFSAQCCCGRYSCSGLTLVTSFTQSSLFLPTRLRNARASLMVEYLRRSYSWFPHSNPYASRPNRRVDNWHDRDRIHVTVRRDRVFPQRGGAGNSQDGTSKNWFKITVSIWEVDGAGGLGLGSERRYLLFTPQNQSSQLLPPQSGTHTFSQGSVS